MLVPESRRKTCENHVDFATGMKINNYFVGNSPQPDRMCEK